MKSRLLLIVVVLALLLSAVSLTSANIQSPARFSINGGRDLNLWSRTGVVNFSFGGTATNLPNAAILCTVSAGSSFQYLYGNAQGFRPVVPGVGIEPTTRQAISLPGYSALSQLNRFKEGNFLTLRANRTYHGTFLIRTSAGAGAKGTIQCLLIDGTTLTDLNNPLAGTTIYAAAVANVNLRGH
ncbi:MAG: hypothetical protein J0M33_16240 [Anaerolineae bacterium]|nr:hypothetical protein [Anaerolineae bacterium]